MGPLSFELHWGPGLAGLIAGLALYGVGIGQLIFYTRAFPHDQLQLKILVFAVFISDSIQTFGCGINIPPTLLLCSGFLYCVTFMVQSFYAHRVWIISGNNRFLTFIVFLSALAQLTLGWVVMVDSIRTPTFRHLFKSKLLPLAAIASAACDATITASIVYYLLPARTGINRYRKRRNYIKKLTAVFVQMGLFSFINALSVVIMYYIQDGGVAQILTAAPGSMLSKSYMNSMFGVLNARKAIREEQQAQAQYPTEVPTLPTIQ